MEDFGLSSVGHILEILGVLMCCLYIFYFSLFAILKKK